MHESSTKWVGKATSLDPSQLQEFLSQPWICHLATLTQAGAPYVTPVWFEYVPDRKVFYIIGRKHSHYVDYIRTDPRVSLSIDMPKAPSARVLVQGKAAIIEGPIGREGRWVEIARRMARRYLGDYMDGPDYIEATADRPRYLLEVRVEKMLSWIGNEWHPRYLKD